ncbi:hypothetical protein SARC_13334 [Sphaeroforma arctica JP610]|uniref:Origin recognition complex subunit 4 C-terminal domain-containing protein n=1 Tax=Sphaeroforma arctica JP610 TaxID=667725 RepID=A0A0L0FBL1_9EUKA|nr:hypothetical protein SARC_13334 [Sphaeroforma arctica JP610]KNC74109.1 hypothetical protein SARC_13334 [Sphaeroforma arctica JP610]|eukprot:XP_014148011.1 hypothetical protein SARC_13334 [Sphaeroforma arctica JP610]
MFEKRVRSRFSHRFIHVYNTLTFEQYSQTAHNLLTVPEDVATSSVAMKSVCKEWDAHTTALCASPKALTALRNQYELDASIRSLQLFLLPLVSRLSVNYNGTVNTRSVSAEAFFARVTELRKDEKIVILKGLTSLELALLIALVCLGSKHGIETFNFEMAYNEYKEFCIGKTTKATGTIPLFSKPVAMKAWERLVQLEMVVTAPGNTKTVTKRHKTHYITISPALLNIALQQHIDCPTALVRWATAGIASSYAYEV